MEKPTKMGIPGIDYDDWGEQWGRRMRAPQYREQRAVFSRFLVELRRIVGEVSWEVWYYPQVDFSVWRGPIHCQIALGGGAIAPVGVTINVYINGIFLDFFETEDVGDAVKALRWYLTEWKVRVNAVMSNDSQEKGSQDHA